MISMYEVSSVAFTRDRLRCSLVTEMSSSSRRESAPTCYIEVSQRNLTCWLTWPEIQSLILKKQLPTSPLRVEALGSASEQR